MVSGCRVLRLSGKSNKTITEEQTPIRKRAAFATLQMKSNSRITFHQFPIAKIQQNLLPASTKKVIIDETPIFIDEIPISIDKIAIETLPFPLYIYIYIGIRPFCRRQQNDNRGFGRQSRHPRPFPLKFLTFSRNLTYKKSGSFFGKSATLFGKSATLFGKSAVFSKLLLQTLDCKVFFLTFCRIHVGLEFNTWTENNTFSSYRVRCYFCCGIYRFDLKPWSKNP